MSGNEPVPRVLPGRAAVLMAVSQDQTGLAYEVRDAEGGGEPCLAWDPEPITNISADDAMAYGRGNATTTALDDAAEWLREALAEGPIEADSLKIMAEQAGHSWGTVKRAKSVVGVEARKEGYGKSGKWCWSLRGAGTPTPETLRPLAEFAPLKADGPENGGDYPPKGRRSPKGRKRRV